MDRKDFESLLKKYPDCISDGKKLKAFLKDLYPDLPKAIVNTLTIMADDGIIFEMQMSVESSILVAARLRKKIEDDYGISQKIISDCFSLIIHDDAKQTQTTNSVESYEKISASAHIASKSAPKKETSKKNTTNLGKESRPQSTPAKDNTAKQKDLNFTYDLKDFEIAEGVLKKYKGSSSDVVIPDSVTSIGWEAFSGCTDLTSITIPDSVTNIGYEAFRGCTGLTSITIPNSVTSIDNRAFYNCTGLTSITIPDSVTSIRTEAFRSCTGLTSITIPESVTSIKGYAFCCCSSLSRISIPHSVTSIGAHAFSGCTGLTSITVPDSVTSIGSNAFSGCRRLTNITIGNGVASIGDCAFYDTPWYNKQPNGLVYAGKVAYEYKDQYRLFWSSAIISITLREDTLGIGENAFAGCRGLLSIAIPDSVTNIGKNAFSGCHGLTNINIGNGVASVGYEAFYDTAWYKNKPDGLVYAGKVAYKYKGFMSSNTSIILREDTIGISEHAFNGCTDLKSVTIPGCVKSIGEYAFAWCSDLTSVTIPDSVVDIGDSAFAGCHNLTIYCEAEKLPKSWTNVNWNPDNIPVVWGVKDRM